MNEAEGLGRRACRYAYELVTMVGARPAGSRQEAAALDWAASKLANWGYRIERLPARFTPLPAFSPLYLFAGLLFVAAGVWLLRLPWLAVFQPLIFAVLPDLSRQIIRRRRLSGVTSNLISRRDTPSPTEPVLLICAHIDSARVASMPTRTGRLLYGRTLDIVQRVAIGLAALGLLRLFGFQLPDILLMGAAILASLAGAWLIFSDLWSQLAHGGRYATGANDNASGVGLLLALAEQVRDWPDPSGLAFLLTGAEETGLHGAHAFAETLSASGLDWHVLCLDMVGAGDTLRYATQDGVFLIRKTDSTLNSWIQAANPAGRGLAYTHRSGDFAAFLQAGIPATSLEVTGSQAAGLAYHSEADQPDLLEPEALDLAGGTVLGVIRRWLESRA